MQAAHASPHSFGAGNPFAAQPARVLIHLDSSQRERMEEALEMAEAYLAKAGKAKVELVVNNSGLDLLREEATPHAERIARRIRETRTREADLEVPDFPGCAASGQRVVREHFRRERLRALIEFALGEGWRVVRTSGGHLKFTKQGCASIYTSSTASDNRWPVVAHATPRAADASVRRLPQPSWS